MASLAEGEEQEIRVFFGTTAGTDEADRRLVCLAGLRSWIWVLRPWRKLGSIIADLRTFPTTSLSECLELSMQPYY